MTDMQELNILNSQEETTTVLSEISPIDSRSFCVDAKGVGRIAYHATIANDITTWPQKWLD